MAVRAIDVPIESLPRIDEHSIEVEAPARDAWETVAPVLRGRFGGAIATRTARWLGCHEVRTGGDPRHPGATVPGFVVARSVPPMLYALLGAHRFARYALVFSVDRLTPDRSRVRAETRAEFPGLAGDAYRALVIGTRAHALLVRRLLRAIKRRAEA